MKDFAASFYNSRRWRKCRQTYIQERMLKDGGLCEVCHQENGYIVHHIKNLTPANINDSSITLSPENLRYECKACHDREEGHFIGPNSEGVISATFDSNGMPIDLRKL